MREMNHLRTVPLALAVLLLVSVPTRADASLEAAREHFEAGLARAKERDWMGALQAFTAAYELAPEATVLFNLAGAQYRCGKLLASTTNYRRVLASDDGELSKEQRAAVTRMIAQIEERMPRLRVHIQGLRGDDRVLLDQARLYPDELDRDMWVDPGSHQLQIVRARGNPEMRTAVLAEGEVRVLALSLP